MRKSWKRALSYVLTAAMAVTGVGFTGGVGSTNPTVASAEEGSGSDPSASPSASADASASPEASADASASPAASADASASPAASADVSASPEASAAASEAPAASGEPEVIAPSPEDAGVDTCTAYLVSHPGTGYSFDESKISPNGQWTAEEAEQNGALTAEIPIKEGKGTYTVSVKNLSGEPYEECNVLCIDVPEMMPLINSAGLEPEVEDLKVFLDGTETEVNLPSLFTGDIEAKGTYRIQIHNGWGGQPSLDGHDALKAIEDEADFAWSDELKVTFTLNLKATTAKTCTAYIQTNEGKDAKGENGVWNPESAVGRTAKVALKEAAIRTADNVPMDPVYSVTAVNNTANDSVSPKVFNVDIVGFDNACKENGWVYEIAKDDNRLYLDGEEVALDKDKMFVGDIEKNGNYRIEIYNEWSDTGSKDDPAITSEKLTYKDEAEVTFKVHMVKGSDNPAPGAEPTQAPAASSYNAYLCFQTDKWAYRNAWDDANGGLKSKDIDYKKEILYDGGKQKTKATIQDVVIDHNGEYTISISDVDLTQLRDSNFPDQAPEKYNIVFISTDIPRTMTNLKFSNVSLTVDGTKTVSYKNDLPIKSDSTKYYTPMLINDGNYGSDNATEYKTSDVGIATKSISVTFTVSGGDFEGTYKTSTLGKKKGATFTSGNFKYKITQVAKKTVAGSKTTTTKGKVSVVGLTSAGKKAKSLTLGPTVKDSKATYTISALAANAFKGAQATKITLNKSIKKLPKNAFAKCTKLSTLTLKAKLTSVNKAAFTGCKKTIKISGTSAAANVKFLNKKTSYKKFK